MANALLPEDKEKCMSDKEIVDLYWQRSEQAITETERKYGRYCHTIAYNILESAEDAEECDNDTWMSAWKSMPDKRPDNLSPFLGRITCNFASWHNKSARHIDVRSKSNIKLMKLISIS